MATLIPDVSNILAKLYTDRMSVQRYPEGGTDADGAKLTDLQPLPVPGLEDIPCRISFASKDSPIMADDSNPSDIHPSLICRPEVPLKSGDYITVKRNGTQIYAGNIGRPNPYGSSLQVMFRDKGKS